MEFHQKEEDKKKRRRERYYTFLEIPEISSFICSEVGWMFDCNRLSGSEKQHEEFQSDTHFCAIRNDFLIHLIQIIDSTLALTRRWFLLNKLASINPATHKQNIRSVNIYWEVKTPVAHCQTIKRIKVSVQTADILQTGKKKQYSNRNAFKWIPEFLPCPFRGSAAYFKALNLTTSFNNNK